jgi:hypothetical protein
LKESVLDQMAGLAMSMAMAAAGSYLGGTYMS